MKEQFNSSKDMYYAGFEPLKWLNPGVEHESACSKAREEESLHASRSRSFQIRYNKKKLSREAGTSTSSAIPQQCPEERVGSDFEKPSVEMRRAEYEAVATTIGSSVIFFGQETSFVAQPQEIIAEDTHVATEMQENV